MANGNGTGRQKTLPAINAMVQYTKDFSFEIRMRRVPLGRRKIRRIFRSR